MNLTPREVLIEARALIDAPEKWMKGHAKSWNSANGVPCYCAVGAVWATALEQGWALCAEALIELAQDLKHPSGCDPVRSIANYNNDPLRTHTEILALFDTAIERLQ